ncbi:MAG: MFS transporter [Dehalococcoidia bacterium]
MPNPMPQVAAETVAGHSSERSIRLGLRANAGQFWLLVLINAFVGGMVGLERSILPGLAESDFGITSATVAVSFIATFGLTKALANLVAGRLAGRFSRRSLLIAGWLCGLPVPLIIIFAPAWSWVVAANVLLGLNQGLCWSMTVNMKIDLVGPRSRGLALGLNEAAGYLAVAVAALLAGLIAERAGFRPEPFYLGIAFASAGLALSVLLVRDTAPFVALEAADHGSQARSPSLWRSFAETTWRRSRLFGITQAGFVNNLNDGLAWGIFPLFFAARDLSLGRIALLAAAYPLVWGGLQLGTGWASDRLGRKPLIVGGMVLQGLAIALIGGGSGFTPWLAGVCLLGLGTAMVYPTLLAAIGDAVHPEERSTALGVYRFWRDAGAMAGALAAGLIADLFGFTAAIQTVAVLTVVSGIVAARTVAPRKEAPL